MRRLLAILLFVASAGLPATLSEDELAGLLNEASSLFREANELSPRDPAAARELYERSALRYERIVREGEIRNGKLFYNIGNAYFQCQNLGRAILNYRRAGLYLPGDAGIEQNLEYARSTRLDRFEEKQETRVLKTLLFWHYDLSPSLRTVLLAIFSGLFWLGAAARLLRPGWAPRTVLAVAGGLAALFLGSLMVESATGGGKAGGVILAQQVTARKGDGASYEPSFTEPLHTGTEFRLLEDREEWLRIELPDGRRCWIQANSAGLVTRF